MYDQSNQKAFYCRNVIFDETTGGIEKELLSTRHKEDQTMMSVILTKLSIQMYAQKKAMVEAMKNHV